jgi:hypothetical protein
MLGVVGTYQLFVSGRSDRVAPNKRCVGVQYYMGTDIDFTLLRKNRILDSTEAISRGRPRSSCRPAAGISDRRNGKVALSGDAVVPALALGRSTSHAMAMVCIST